MILTCEIPQLDIPDVGRNHILYFFLFQPVKSFQYKRFIQTAALSKISHVQCTMYMHMTKLMRSKRGKKGNMK